MVNIDANGDVLYMHVSGHCLPPGPNGLLEAFLNYEYLGGTGRFAGARGSASSTSWHRFLSPVEASIEPGALVTGTLWLADLQPKMVAARTWEAGDPVSLVMEGEAFPLVFTENTFIGYSTHLGRYVSYKRGLIDFSASPVQAWGFATVTAANGDILYCYWKVQLVPSPTVPDAFDAALQLWDVGGTGNLVNVSGYLTGSGLYFADGSEDLFFSGAISSVGSRQ